MPRRGRGGQRRPRRRRAHRRPVALLTPPARRVGIDLGGTKCLGVALDADGVVVAEHRVATPEGAPAVVAALVEVAAAVGPPSAVGVGAPGLVDVEGVLRFAPNLPGIVDLNLRVALEDRFPGVPVQVDNDATCAGWAEAAVGAAGGAPHTILVTLGTGIGGGIVVAGRLLRGANGFAGEVGHMVVDPAGPPCPCGKRGCWERFASGSALGRLGREAATAAPGRMVELAGGDPEDVRGEHVTAAAAEGDDQASAVVKAFAWWVALGLANLANAFDPTLFVLGGGLVEAGDVLLAPVREAFAGLVLAARHRPAVPIVPAALGEHAGAIGAALLAGEAVTR